MAKILISWFDFSISHADLHIEKFDFTISRFASNFYAISAQMGTRHRDGAERENIRHERGDRVDGEVNRRQWLRRYCG